MWAAPLAADDLASERLGASSVIVRWFRQQAKYLEPMTDEAGPVFDAAGSINAIRYEYQMAVETAARVPSIPSRANLDAFIRAVALLESFLVHARNLDGFLSDRGWLDTDVNASDFVDGYVERPLADDLVGSINRRLQHITTYRQEDHVGWAPIAILQPIASSMGRFIEQLADEAPELAARLSDVHRDANRVIESGLATGPVITSTSFTEVHSTIFFPLPAGEDDEADS